MLPPANPAESSRLTEAFFRHEAGKVVSLLVRSLGPEHIQLAEDVVQEAIMRALRIWPFQGVPENPSAWLTLTAKNLALDAVRRDQLFRKKQVDMFGSVHRWSGRVVEGDLDEFERAVEDSVLRLMFVCCHPSVPANSQPALALKTLCGFGVGEIASALFSSEAAIAKRLTRAKEVMSNGDIPADLPIGEDLNERLDGVLKTIYLLFNEGYKASSGAKLVREDLCAEAIRLGSILGRMPVGDRPQVHALLALMLLHASRLPARVDSRGNILLLKDQDRSLWDHALIARGLDHLARSAAGEELDSLHLQAAIAAVHCTSSTFSATNWARIKDLYDLMVQIDPSPLVALNRAVAVGQLLGAEAGLEEIEAISGLERLDSYHLLYAVQAEFALELGRTEEASGLFRKSLELAESGSERSFLLNRLEHCRLASSARSE